MTGFVEFFTFTFGLIAAGHVLAGIGGAADGLKVPAWRVLTGMLALGLTIWGVFVLGLV